MLRPLLACLATKSAAEAGSPANLYSGRLWFKRPGPEGPVWILGHFENQPGIVRVTFRRSSSPPEALPLRVYPPPLGTAAGSCFAPSVPNLGTSRSDDRVVASTRPDRSIFSASTLRPSTELRLPENAPRLKLFRVLKKAWKNLRAELCPRQPKSIWKIARDLLRNLPHWQRHVDARYLSSHTAIDISKEADAYKSVFEAAKTTIDRLRVLVDDDVRDHPHAEEEWHTLLVAVQAALWYINGDEFAALDNARPKPVLEAEVAVNAEQQAR